VSARFFDDALGVADDVVHVVLEVVQRRVVVLVAVVRFADDRKGRVGFAVLMKKTIGVTTII
jgi:hypothetical protein